MSFHHAENFTMRNGSKRKRKHHYIPCYYLKHFATPCSRRGKIYVVDLKSAVIRPSIVEQVGFENNYFSLEGNCASDALEELLAGREGELSDAWQRMVDNKTFPTDPTDRNWIVNVIVMISARNPARRSTIEKMFTDLYRAAMDLTASDPDLFESKLRESMEGDDVALGELDHTDVEALRQSYLSGEFRITAEIPNNFYITETAEISLTLHKNFHARHWSLLDFSSTNIKIISSDDPVCCFMLQSNNETIIAGFGMLKSLVIVPVNSSLVLVGAFRKEEFEIEQSESNARLFNRIIIEQAYRFLYCETGVLEWKSYEGNSVGTDLLIRSISFLSSPATDGEILDQPASSTSLGKEVLIDIYYRDEEKIERFQNTVRLMEQRS